MTRYTLHRDTRAARRHGCLPTLIAWAAPRSIACAGGFYLLALALWAAAGDPA